MTDTHLGGGGAPPFGDGRPRASFAEAVEVLTGRSTDAAAARVLDRALSGEPVDLILHTGDVVDTPSPDTYEQARALFTVDGTALLVTPGNHDDPDLLASAFGPPQTGGCSHLDLGAWRVVVADSSCADEHGRLAPDGLERLDELLGVDRPALIGLHHPPMSTCAHPDCGVVNRDAFFAVIDRHPNVVAVASGHLHVAAELERRGVRYLLGPSTCLQLHHVHPLPLHNHSATWIGARLIDLQDDGGLVSTVVSLPPEPEA